MSVALHSFIFRITQSITHTENQGERFNYKHKTSKKNAPHRHAHDFNRFSVAQSYFTDSVIG